ncbi:MAG: bifunctional riboflavin kinase/FAD synthetase [Bacteroidetes bacterium]|nr:MAG: bifunctional riboflavin kinase/FAD synthetase [Bacteroidota bacterium]
MLVHRQLHLLPRFTNAVVTIGTFDGVHAGHQQIIAQLKQVAAAVGGQTVIITFHPHPRKIVGQNGGEIRLLNALNEKIELLTAAQIDHLVVVPFTSYFADMSAETYVTDFLVRYFTPHTIVVGYDHRFGHQRQGNFSLLQSMGQQHHFVVKEIPEQLVKESTVSSTTIRQALLNGNVTQANACLGYTYFFEGQVVQGNQLGRTIGFPTANLQPIDGEKLIPGNGVYAVQVNVAPTNGKPNPAVYNGMMNIGVRPTVEGTSRVIEVHIFNFDANIYQQTLRVFVHQKLRAEIKFDGLPALKQQLAHDKQNALQHLALLTP